MVVHIGFLEEPEETLTVDLDDPSAFPSKVGGKPLWLDPTNPLRASDVTCGRCGSVMPLTLQLYTPEHGGEDAYHRVVYVFGCKKGACFHEDPKASLRAFRTQLPKLNPYVGTARKPFEPVQYCGREHQVHHWTVGGHKEACAAAVATQTAAATAADASATATADPTTPSSPTKETAASSHPTVPKPDPKKGLIWPELELISEEEPPAPAESKLPASLRGATASAKDDDPDQRGFGPERYERYSTGVDAQFLRFQKRVARASDQVVRYARTDEHSDNDEDLSSTDDDDQDSDNESAASDSSDSDSDADAPPAQSFSKIKTVPHSSTVNGSAAVWTPPARSPTPLWASEVERPAKGDVPDCERCGGRRGFEFQIMPSLLLHLPIDHLARDAIDFGTLVLFTCESSCALSSPPPDTTVPTTDNAQIRKWAREVIWRQMFSTEGARVGGGGSAGKMKGDKGRKSEGKGKGKSKGKDKEKKKGKAYNPTIGEHASLNGSFSGCDAFSTTRMTWFKPNFLWMMYRCGWATKHNQETVLAVTLTREFFDRVLAQGAASLGSRAKGQKFDVQIQWDPDHGPDGRNEQRRAIQIGVKGELGEAYGRGEGVVKIEDVTDFVRAQSAYSEEAEWGKLEIPVETVYEVRDVALRAQLGLT
ncbi:hypothetical protein HDU93_001624 [Gonapodya sp. JEL0774]|nr:hypothetical protein HDU93_001624 [Gonapodya sp. JEL0774]